MIQFVRQWTKLTHLVHNFFVGCFCDDFAKVHWIKFQSIIQYFSEYIVFTGKMKKSTFWKLQIEIHIFDVNFE